MSYLKNITIAIALCTIAIVQANPKNNHSTLKDIQQQNQQLTLPLTIGVINKIPVKMNDGLTTIIFPGPITEIAGRNISSTGNGCDFAIVGKPNSTSFAIAAMAPNVNGTLTVTYKNNLYILYIYQDKNQACATVRFTDTESITSTSYSNTTPNVSSARLISLIDISKNYHAILTRYPSLLANTQRKEYKNRYRCGAYDIHLLSVTRFEAEDTLIFQLELENLTDKEILYDKHSFSAHTGSSISYMSVSDATGVMPPRSKTSAYFGITSTSTGGRNNLLPDNEWLLGLSTRNVHLNQVTQIKDNIKANLEKERKQKLAQEKEITQKLKKLDTLSRQLTQEQKQLKEKILRLNNLEAKLKKQEELLNQREKALDKEKDQKAAQDKEFAQRQKKLDLISTQLANEQKKLEEKVSLLNNSQNQLKAKEEKLTLEQKSFNLEKAQFTKEKADYLDKNKQELNKYKKELENQNELKQKENQLLLLKEQEKIKKLQSSLDTKVEDYQKKTRNLLQKEKALMLKETQLQKLQSKLQTKEKLLLNKEEVANSVIKDLVTKTLPKLNSLNTNNSSNEVKKQPLKSVETNKTTNVKKVESTPNNQPSNKEEKANI